MDEFAMTPSDTAPDGTHALRESGVSLWRQIVRVIDGSISNSTLPFDAVTKLRAELNPMRE